MKRFLLIICLSGVLNAIGQISPGTVASDFTVQDITGNSYNLYNELDSGKTVLLHCFAAWDSFAWEYYQQHVLEAFNSLYGEPGNGSVAIWRVECETQNSTAQLQGPASNTGNIATDTQGDWLSASTLPLFDDSTLAAQFALPYLPVIIVICPDRIVRFANQMAIGNLANLVFQSSCPPVVPGFDPALLSVTTSRTCGNGNVDLEVVIKNLGTDTLYNATLELSGATPEQSVAWSGQLSSYQSDTLTLQELAIISDGDINLAIIDSNVNTANDSLSVRSNVGFSTQLIKLELALDAYPDEVSWEIRDETDSVIYNGGGYEVDYQYISNVFQLPSSGCYNFYLNDTRGDGLHGSQYGGFDGFCKLYSMIDSTTVEEEMFHYDGSFNFSSIENSPSFLQYSFEAGSPIGVDDREITWNAYPMPANQKLFLQKTGSLLNYNLFIADLAGRLVSAPVTVFGPGIIEVDVSSIPAGIYVLSLRSNLYQENFSIVVQH